MSLHKQRSRLDLGTSDLDESADSSDLHQVDDVSDVVLLSRRLWKVTAEREALHEAVTLVDSLLGQEPSRRRCRLDLLGRAMRVRNEVDDPPEERCGSMDNFLLGRSFEDLRRRSFHADFEGALVGSGRLRRQNALSGRVHNRWHQVIPGNDNPPCPPNIKRHPRWVQRVIDEPLIQTPRRSPRSRLGDLNIQEPPEKLSQSHQVDDIQPSSLEVSQSAVEALPDPDTGMAETQKDLPDDVIAQLECPVCLDYLSPPIKQCANGHCVCSGCSPRLSHCATCRAGFIATPNVVLENLVRSLLFPCRYRDSGCTEILKMEGRPNHESSCVFRPRQCPLCEWSGLTEDVKKHVRSSHDFITMYLGVDREIAFSIPDGAAIHDEKLVWFVESDNMLVFESHYDEWRSHFIMELCRFGEPGDPLGKSLACDIELYAKSTHLKLRNLVDGSRTTIKIDLDMFNKFVSDGQYTLHVQLLLLE